MFASYSRQLQLTDSHLSWRCISLLGCPQASWGMVGLQHAASHGEAAAVARVVHLLQHCV